MFSFLKKRNVEVNTPKLTLDIHSHLIPGIDDGSQSMKESIILLKGMSDLGYEKVITTPHIMLDTYRNTPNIIYKGLSDLRNAVKEENIDIDIEAAAEYYLDDGFYDLLQKGDILSIKNEYLLFETSYVSKPFALEEMIFEISAAGYTPMMAHPERYRYIRDPKKEYTRLKELGVMFQVNLNSFLGHYGKSAKALANFLSNSGMIDFLGSDVHHKKQIETLSNVFQSDIYQEIFRNNSILNDTLN